MRAEATLRGSIGESAMSRRRVMVRGLVGFCGSGD